MVGMIGIFQQTYQIKKIRQSSSSWLKSIWSTKGLKDTVYTFRYNDINSFREIVEKHDIGIVKMEVSRSNEPNIQFLNEIREICNKHSIVLIFDECTSGFRSAFGGIHKILE